MSIAKGLFVYPWTLGEAGIDEPIRYYKEELGVDSLYVNGSYHSGRFFQPTAGTRLLTRHDSGLSFIPDPALYPQELQPAIDKDAQPGLHERIRESCDKHGVTYHSWAVGLHNSTLGRAHPECCVTNIYGTTFDYALCPNQPVVRQYFQGLVQDVAQNLRPKQLLLETPNFLGFIHGHHHELILSQLGPVGEYLLSLCFCDACKQRARAEGIDVEQLEHIVKQRIAYLIDRERGGIAVEFTQGELASLLVEEPLIHAYTLMRIRSVTELLRDTHQFTQKQGIRLLTVPSVFTRPGSKAWMEGTGLKELDAFIDGFMLLSYFPNAAWVKADIEWLRLFSSTAPLYCAFNAGGSDAPDEATLRTCVSQAVAFDPKAIVFYNASLLSNTRLKWIGNIFREI